MRRQCWHPMRLLSEVGEGQGPRGALPGAVDSQVRFRRRGLGVQTLTWDVWASDNRASMSLIQILGA